MYVAFNHGICQCVFVIANQISMGERKNFILLLGTQDDVL